MRTGLIGITAAFGLLLSSPAAAQIDLQNDSFMDGQAVGFQVGFVADEEGASTFVVPGGGSTVVQSIRFLFGGAAGTEMVTIVIYDDSALATDPGAPIYVADFNLTGSNDMLQEVDLTADNVIVSGAFRVALRFQHTGLPSIARDDDMTNTAGRNWLRTAAGWFPSQMLGVTGDWIIRATIADPGNTPDAGVGGDAGPGADAGTGGACVLNSDCNNGQYCSDTSVCTFDCRVDLDCMGDETCNSIGQCVADDGGGCGCEGGGGAPLGGVLLIAAVMLLLRRRGDAR